jgi:hypothetical protein
LRHGNEALLRQGRRNDSGQEPQLRREDQAAQQRAGLERE